MMTVNKKRLLAVAAFVAVAALSAALGLRAARGRVPDATAALEPVPAETALPPVTALPVTPTAPITPVRFAAWYPTSQPHFLPPSVTARGAAFAPSSFDMAFVLNKAADGDAPDVFLAVAGPDGELSGQAERLVGLPDDAAVAHVVSHQAARRYALGAVAGGGSAGRGRYSDVWLVSEDGHAVQRLTDGTVDVADFWWLPDGAALAVLEADGRLVVRDIGLGPETVLAHDLLTPSGAAGVYLAWAPDGSAAVLGTYDADDLSGRLELVRRSDGRRTVLARFAESGMPLPVFAPDGGRVFAFVTDGENTTRAALYEVDLQPGGGQRYLADLGVAGDASAWVRSALAHPTQPYLIFVQDGAVRRINTDGTGLADVVPRGDEVVRGDVLLRVLPDGRARVGYVASTYLGDAGAATDGGQTVSTAFGVRSAALPDAP